MSKERILCLKNVILDKLPDSFRFEGTLDLRGSSIKELPEEIYISEDLYLNEYIIEVPKNATIGRNLITELPYEELKIDKTAIIAGKVIAKNIAYAQDSSQNNCLILENGEVFWYKRKQHYTHRALRDHNFDRTPFDIFYGYNEKDMVVQWETPRGVFTKICKDKSDAKFLVNYQDAIERGLEQYRGLDIDKPMLGHDILEIYQVCTHSCLPVIKEYLNRFGLSLDNYYTLRQIGYTVQQFKDERYAPASDVFMNFFNIPNYKEVLKNG